MSPKLFPVVVRRVVQGAPPPSGGQTFAERHRLIYELPEVAPAAVELVLLQALARYDEAAPVPKDDVVLVAAILTEVAPAAAEASVVVARAIEQAVAPLPADTLLLALRAGESAPAALEAVRLAALAGETAPEAVDAFSAIVRAFVGEAVPPSVDLASIGPSVAELAPVPGPETAEHTIRFVPGSNAASNLGPNNWTNPTNAQAKKNGTLASAADTSALSALDFNLLLGYPDPTAFVRSFAIINVELLMYVKHSPTALTPTAFQPFRRFVNETSAWTQITWPPNANGSTGTTVGRDHLTNPAVVDLTDVVAGSWDRIAGFEFRLQLADQFATPGGGTGNADCDAVELLVTCKTKAL